MQDAGAGNWPSLPMRGFGSSHRVHVQRLANARQSLDSSLRCAQRRRGSHLFQQANGTSQPNLRARPASTERSDHATSISRDLASDFSTSNHQETIAPQEFRGRSSSTGRLFAGRELSGTVGNGANSGSVWAPNWSFTHRHRPFESARRSKARSAIKALPRSPFTDTT